MIVFWILCLKFHLGHFHWRNTIWRGNDLSCFGFVCFVFFSCFLYFSLSDVRLLVKKFSLLMSFSSLLLSPLSGNIYSVQERLHYLRLKVTLSFLDYYLGHQNLSSDPWVRAICFYYHSLTVNCKTLTPEYRINWTSGTSIVGILSIGGEPKEKEKKITVRCITSIRNKGRCDTYIGRNSGGGVGRQTEVFQADRKNRGTNVKPDNVD